MDHQFHLARPEWLTVTLIHRRCFPGSVSWSPSAGNFLKSRDHRQESTVPGSKSNSSSQGKSLWTCTSGRWSREVRASSVRTWSRHCWKKAPRYALSTTSPRAVVPIWQHLEGRYDWIEGDLADFDICRRAVEGVACVFHQAAIPSVPRSVREPLSSHVSGPTATLNLLEAARQAGVRRFIFAASSSAIRGDDGPAEARGHAAATAQPLRRRQARW